MSSTSLSLECCHDLCLPVMHQPVPSDPTLATKTVPHTPILFRVSIPPMIEVQAGNLGKSTTFLPLQPLTYLSSCSSGFNSRGFFPSSPSWRSFLFLPISVPFQKEPCSCGLGILGDNELSFLSLYCIFISPNLALYSCSFQRLLSFPSVLSSVFFLSHFLNFLSSSISSKQSTSLFSFPQTPLTAVTCPLPSICPCSSNVLRCLVCLLVPLWISVFDFSISLPRLGFPSPTCMVFPKPAFW